MSVDLIVIIAACVIAYVIWSICLAFENATWIDDDYDETPLWRTGADGVPEIDETDA